MHNIAVVGLGVIGRRHAEIIQACPYTQLTAIVGKEHTRQAASLYQVPFFTSLEALFEIHRPDGVILATPNHLHVSGALTCAVNGVSALIEKPLATSVESAVYLVETLKNYDVPMLVGHHRRHSAALQSAKAYIQEGHLGKLVSVTGSAQFYKPDSYFEEGPWRKEKGAGTMTINLIHEIDNLRFLCGDISNVQAMASNTIRNFEVEDTAVINFRFANGMLGSFTLSDTAVLPMSWEQTSGENKTYAAPDNHGISDCYFIAGTKGSIAVPSLRTWRYAAKQSWFEPYITEQLPLSDIDPLEAQLIHFCDVITRKAPPIVSPTDALESLKVLDSIFASLE
jgi:predicted dehydrogenase